MSPMMKTLGMLCLLALPFAVSANPDEDGQGERRRGPPPEAIEACVDLSESDTCFFEGRRGEETGTCAAGPSPELPLACRPDNRPPRQ